MKNFQLYSNNAPRLRFSVFRDEWRENTLGDIANFSKGTGISKDDTAGGGTTKAIRYGELYTIYYEVIKNIYSMVSMSSKGLVFSKANDIIIPASGETNIDIAKASCVLCDGIALGGDINIIRSKQNGIFLSYYLNSVKKKDIARLAQGVSVVHIYSSNLKQLKLTLPSQEEQQKIADFLMAVDDRIELISKKVELLKQYKKSVMQKIFSQQIRFKEENGDSYPKWENKKLGDIGITYNGLTGKVADDFGEGCPFITYKQIFDSYTIDVNKFSKVRVSADEKQNTAKHGDIFFTTSSETPNEVGYSSVLLENIDNLYLNSFCFGYRVKSKEILFPEFARFLFMSPLFRKKITTLAQGSTRYNISKAGFIKIGVSLPVIYEQKKIADYLTTLDDKINLSEKESNQAKQFKKALLQRMFV